MNPKKEVIIIHNDPDEYLAKCLVSYLSGKLEGCVVSRRNERWGCDPKYYLRVIRLNGAGSKIDSSPFSKSIRDYTSKPFSEARKETFYAELSPQKHADLEARKLAKVIEESLQ